eukprot:g2663.t1
MTCAAILCLSCGACLGLVPLVATSAAGAILFQAVLLALLATHAAAVATELAWAAWACIAHFFVMVSVPRSKCRHRRRCSSWPSTREPPPPTAASLRVVATLGAVARGAVLVAVLLACVVGADAASCSGTVQLSATPLEQTFTDGSAPHATYSNSIGSRRRFTASSGGCFWKITAPAGALVRLRFTRFDTESGWDEVNIYDGGSTSATRVVSGHSGSSAPADVLSTGPSLLVQFGSDSSTARTGFEARYSAAGGDSCQAELKTSGSCGGDEIKTLAQCSAAAARLGLSDTTAADDNQARVNYDPPGCYFESGVLKFDSDGNTGSCSSSDQCVCCTQNPKPPAQSASSLTLVNTRMSWYAARTYCQSRGGDLVSIPDKATFDAVVAELDRQNAQEDVWLGLADTAREGAWLSVDGSAVYDRWNTGEPNNCCGSTVDCGYLYRQSSKPRNYFDDTDCATQFPFLCTAASTPGLYQDQQGQTACKDCAVGLYNDQTAQYAAGDCKACAVGLYNDQTAQDAAGDCKACGNGKYNDQTAQDAQTDCKECATGRHGDQQGQSSASRCKDCLSGHYADERGQSTCKGCATGRYGDQQGQSSMSVCKACAAGWYANKQGQSSAIVCTACVAAHSKAFADATDSAHRIQRKQWYRKYGNGFMRHFSSAPGSGRDSGCTHERPALQTVEEGAQEEKTVQPFVQPSDRVCMFRRSSAAPGWMRAKARSIIQRFSSGGHSSIDQSSSGGPGQPTRFRDIQRQVSDIDDEVQSRKVLSGPPPQPPPNKAARLRQPGAHSAEAEANAADSVNNLRVQFESVELGFSARYLKNGKVRVGHVEPGSQAESLGVHAGVEVLSVGGKSVRGMGGKAFAALLLGAKRPVERQVSDIDDEVQTRKVRTVTGGEGDEMANPMHAEQVVESKAEPEKAMAEPDNLVRGVLEKKGYRGGTVSDSWKKRFFVYDPNTGLLKYGADEAAAFTQPLGQCTVNGVAGDVADRSGKRQNRFDLDCHNAEKGAYCLQVSAQSFADKQRWMSALAGTKVNAQTGGSGGGVPVSRLQMQRSSQEQQSMTL